MRFLGLIVLIIGPLTWTKLEDEPIAVIRADSFQTLATFFREPKSRLQVQSSCHSQH